MSHSSVKKWKRFLLFSSTDHLSGRITPGYTKQSIPIDAISRSWAIESRQIGRACTLRTDDKLKHVAPLLHGSFTSDSHPASIFFTRQSLHALQDMVRAYGGTVIVNENALGIDLWRAWNRWLSLSRGQMALSIFAKHHAKVLNKAMQCFNALQTNMFTTNSEVCFDSSAITWIYLAERTWNHLWSRSSLKKVWRRRSLNGIFQVLIFMRFQIPSTCRGEMKALLFARQRFISDKLQRGRWTLAHAYKQTGCTACVRGFHPCCILFRQY